MSNEPPSSKAPRKLGLHHLALFRGHLDGISLGQLGERYLETGNDVVMAKETLRWVRDELIRAARKHKPAVARLLRIPLSRIDKAKTDAGEERMDLETFRSEHDPEGFYSESELQEMFQEAFGSKNPGVAKNVAQSNRLRAKIRDAIAWLESWAVSTPQRLDPVSAWLNEGVSERLLESGIATMGDLLGLIESQGKDWHQEVPYLGPIRASQLEINLRNLKLIQQEPLPSSSSIISASDRYGIAPMGRTDLPHVLSGTEGSNRAYGTALTANNDWEAVKAWLSNVAHKKHTARSYQKEAERFLLWCIYELGKPMSSATSEDCISYRNFLSLLDPEREKRLIEEAVSPENPHPVVWQWNLPREAWVGPKNVSRLSKKWKPFSGKLVTTSQRQAVVILTIMGEWLAKKMYLNTNPWDGVKPMDSSTPTLRADHSLTTAQWDTVIETLERTEVKDEAYMRLRFALELGYQAGIRLDEMVQAKIAKHMPEKGDPNPGLKPGEDGNGWDLTVVGKGNKARTLPLSDELMETLSTYMDARGLGRDPHQWGEGVPLLATLPYGLQYRNKDERKAMSQSALYRMFKNHFAAASRSTERARDAGHLKQASTHWLRHTHATHALKAGADLVDVQNSLGHASLSTTSVYVHTTRERQKRMAENLAKRCISTSNDQLDK